MCKTCQPLPLGPVNPKHEILKSLMWDMGYAIWARTQECAGGIYLASSTLWNPACGRFARGEIPQGKSQISHPQLEKAIAIATRPRPQVVVSHSGMKYPGWECAYTVESGEGNPILQGSLEHYLRIFLDEASGYIIVKLGHLTVSDRDLTWLRLSQCIRTAKSCGTSLLNKIIIEGSAV